jgi:hypothetical protein
VSRANRAQQHSNVAVGVSRPDDFRPIAPLYPELMAELEAIKRDRIGGLMFCRDKDQRPWPTWPDPEQPDPIDLTHMSRTVKRSSRRRACARN